MTEKELQNEIDRAKQDAITLDYSKWSFQQSQAKLPNDHTLWQQKRDRVINQQKSDNDATRASYLQDLENKKAERQHTDDAEIDRQLEPQKQTLMREWRANHPGKTTDDFNKPAWIHLRQNLIEQGNADAMNAQINSLKSSGRYSV